LPPFVWLTSRGSTIAGGRFRTWQPNHGLVAHIEAVTNVRLLLERQLRLGRWECERSLARHIRSGRKPNAHLPDAVLHTESRVAIEVELTRKSRSRLKKIVTDLSVDYDRVLYFAAARPYATLAELAAESPLGNIAVHPYPLDTADVTALRLTST
jgi:hypothetical protein